MKRIIALLSVLVLCFPLTACISAEDVAQGIQEGLTTHKESAPEGEHSSNKEDSAEEMSYAERLATLQGAYAKAPEYVHMARGYFEDPFDSSMVRDAYVPLAKDFVQDDLHSLYSEAHGVGIRVYGDKGDRASAVCEKMQESYLKKLSDRGLEATALKIMPYDNDTVALLPVGYEDEQGDLIAGLLYADIRDNGCYMCAEIEINFSQMDDTTPNLLAEIDDCYAITTSEMLRAFQDQENGKNAGVLVL